MAPFYLIFFKYVNTTRITPDKMSVQASLPRVMYLYALYLSYLTTVDNERWKFNKVFQR